MNRSLAYLLVAAIAVSMVVFAAQKSFDEGSQPPTRPVTGVLVKWDEGAKTFTLKMGNGPNEAQFLWTDQTMFDPRPKIGDRVTVRYRKEAPMRLVAEVVLVKPPQPAPK